MLTPEFLRSRGLRSGGRYLPYNPHLTEKATFLRNHMTEPEKLLWKRYLRPARFTVLRQRPIDQYIVDFYCPSVRLVIEIDGESHERPKAEEYDAERDAILKSYGITILHITNDEVMNNFSAVCRRIENEIQHLRECSKPPA